MVKIKLCEEDSEFVHLTNDFMATNSRMIRLTERVARIF